MERVQIDRREAVRVSECARKAALEAAEVYYEMSGGMSVHDGAIETFVSSKIAEALYRTVPDLAVRLEARLVDIDQDCGARRRGRTPAFLLGQGRIDVTCYKKGRPVGLIEVKKRFAAFRADADLVRLERAMQYCGPASGGSVEYGIWVAIQRDYAGQRQTSQEAIRRMQDSFEWAHPADIHVISTMRDFGSAKNGRSVVGLSAYSVLLGCE